MATSTFWFESLQNWQSEFVSIVAIVGFTIFLRQQGRRASLSTSGTTRPASSDVAHLSVIAEIPPLSHIRYR
jgi:hypothetical protein